MRRKTRWPAHRITTAHLQAAYPFVAEGGLGSRGVYIGRDLYGGAFVYDPWTLYSQGIHGPNMLVFGQIGYAKSSLMKCVSADTEIVDPRTGLVHTIERVVSDRDLDEVLTLADGEIKAVPISAKADTGTADCLRITLASGRSITATHEHPFLTPAGWRRADQLQMGETAGVAAHIPFPAEPGWLPAEQVDLMAIMLAEGCCTPVSPSVGFTSGDPEIVRRMTAAGDRLGFKLRKISKDDYRLIARNAADAILKGLGVPRSLAKDKTFPDVVFRLDGDQLAHFLGVFWMCDGFVSSTGPGITLASEKMVRQVQHLLLRFGIQSRVAAHSTRANGKSFDSWTLRVYSASYMDFLFAIPLWGHKQERLTEVTARRNRSTVRRMGSGLPSISDELKSELRAVVDAEPPAKLQKVSAELGVSWRFQFSHLFTPKGSLNRRAFRAFIKVYEVEDRFGWILDSEVFWDRVVSIERAGQRHVYDLTVQPSANFIANDLVAHNTYLWRQMLFNKTAWIVDPKGEYDTLAYACGTDPIRFVSGGSLRLNPLDPAIGGDAQLVLLRSIAEVMLGRGLAPEEDASLERAHMEVAREAAERGVQAITPEVVRRLLDPSQESADELRTSRERLAEDGRQLGLGLRRMGSGDLRGMFDGPTSKGLDLSGRLVSFNLREVNDAARPILMACTAAWLQGAWARNDGIHRIVVLDEAWVILRHLAIARWLRESWKLARSYGVQCVAVMHRLSDLTAAGDEGSEQVQLAKGLLEDSETRVIYRQSWGEVEKARELLGLTQIEVEQIPNLQRGEALWRVGQRSFIVQHRLSPIYERELVDTDANMNVRPSAVAGSPLVPADTEPPVALDLGPPPEGDPLEADLDPSRPYQS